MRWIRVLVLEVLQFFSNKINKHNKRKILRINNKINNKIKIMFKTLYYKWIMLFLLDKYKRMFQLDLSEKTSKISKKKNKKMNNFFNIMLVLMILNNFWMVIMKVNRVLVTRI
jgi:hypothetical protein